MSPTQRTLKYMRDCGYTCGIVERFISARKIRMDFLGLFDVIGFREGVIIGVQTTSANHHADHKSKMLANDNLPKWKEAKCSAWLITWAKTGDRGKRKTWKPRIEVL